MKAIILVGGEGTRLRPLTYITPKAMMPVLNVPFIHHVVEYLKLHGVDMVVLSMGYKPDPIKKYFEKHKPEGIEIIYNIEDKPLGTAGAVKFAGKYVEPGETVFVLNGDIFTDINLTEMLAQHRSNKARVTITLTAVEDPSLFGVVELDKDNRVLNFIEKPKKEEAPSNLINAGIYLMDFSILDPVPDNEFFMLERGVFPKLVTEKEPVFGYVTNSYWIDMGNPQKYRQLNHDLLTGKCSTTAAFRDRMKIDTSTKFDQSLTISGHIAVDTDCIIKENASIDNSVIGSGCVIEKNCSVEESIIWTNVKIGSNSRIKNSIIASDCIVGDNAAIENDVIIKK